MIRTTKDFLPQLNRVAALTGDRFTYKVANIKKENGSLDLNIIDITVLGDKEREGDFWEAFKDYCEVDRGLWGESNYYLFRKHSDQIIKDHWGKDER